MRRSRMFFAAASVVALLGATAATGGTASAASSGVGTSSATDSILKLALGSNPGLLNIQLLGDNGKASIDPTVIKPSTASSGISAASVASSVPALNLGTIGAVNTSSTGAAKNVAAGPISLALPNADVGLLKKGVVSDGSIDPATLRAAVDSAGATSGLDTTLKSVALAGGLLSLDGTSNLGTSALSGDAEGLRGVDISSLKLDLGALLRGLGIDETNLSLTTIQNLLNSLQASVPANGTTLTPTAVVALINGATTQIANLTGLQVLGTTPLTDPAVTGAGISTSTITGLLPPGTAAPTTVSGAITALQGQLTTLLNSVLSSLANAPLLEVDNIVAGLNTKAGDTVANSLAQVTATVGALNVGNTSIAQNLDLAGAANQVTTAVTGATSQLNGVLNNLGLSGLISLKLLDQSKSISTSGGYTHALAGLNVLHVAITPPANLSAIVNGLNNVAVPGAAAQTNPISGLFPQGTSPAALDAAMASLNSSLVPSALGALAQGATVDAVTLQSASDFGVSATPANPAAPNAPAGTLATTGGRTQLLGFVGLLLLATVAGLRWLRRPAMTD